MQCKSFKELGQTVIHQTRAPLFVGSANILEDREKTGHWTLTLLSFIRNNRSWKETKFEDKKVVLSGDEQRFLKWKKAKTDSQKKPRWLADQIRYSPKKHWQIEFKENSYDVSLSAARASYYKAGNSGEIIGYGKYKNHQKCYKVNINLFN